MEHIHNQLTNKHFAWFDKEVITQQGESECTEGQIEVLVETLEEKAVFKYWVTELLQSKRKLESVSFDEVMESKGVITPEEYNLRSTNGTLFFPFKKEVI